MIALLSVLIAAASPASCPSGLISLGAVGSAILFVVIVCACFRGVALARYSAIIVRLFGVALPPAGR